MNGSKAYGVTRMHQNETWSHTEVNHTRNIAAGSTAIRQATCPIVYGEA